MAGCAVVIKPSEITPLGLAEIVDGWKRRSAPPTSSTSSTAWARPASALVDEVDFVQFTGSDRTGRRSSHAPPKR